jgi:diacylglycerol O-acyltransferase 2, plant
VIPGGIAEMYHQYPDKEVVKLQGRRGFVKVAVEEGRDIVPVYHFGNTQLLEFGPKSWEGLGRKYRMAVGFVHGRWVL